MTWQQQEDCSPPSEWESAPPSEVAGLRQKLRARRKRRIFLRAAAGAAATLFVTGSGVGLWWLSGRNREYDIGGVTCSEVMRLAEAYRAQKLVAADQERVRQHIAQCPQCRPHFRDVQG